MISLGMIVRNEGRTLKRCLESVAPHVDEIVIGLAGESTDDTAAIARQFTDKVVPIEWHDDFADARNQVMDLCSGEWYLWLDGDDELVNGHRMRELIEQNPEIGAFYWGYDYARDESGTNVCYLIRERLVNRALGWRWNGAIHEVLTGPEHSSMLVQDVLTVHHKGPEKHDPWRNRKVLYRLLEESEPNPDPRILVYLASENATHGNLQEALLHWNRYVQLSQWDEEKYQAKHKMADTYRLLGEHSKALASDFAAIAIKPDWPDAFLGIAETYYAMGNYRGTIEWVKAASTKEKPQTMLILNPRDYDYTPLVVLSLAYWRLGDFEMALANAEKAYQINKDTSLGQHIELLKEEVNNLTAKQAFLALWEFLGRNDEWLKARKLFDSVPKLIEQYPDIAQRRIDTLQWTAHVEDPNIMIEAYVNNPHWQAMKDEEILDPDWINYPRLAYALNVIRQQKAQNVIDFGCSDGFITLPIARELPNVPVLGIDLDPRCIELANRRADEWGITHAGFETGNATTYQSRGKFDVGLAFEVIEHVVDPDEFLSNLELSAKHIALTTPYLAWEKGHAPGWDKPDLKGHLRIFDLDDVERMLAPRGRIHNLYRQPWGNTGWIFADYKPGERAQGSVTIAAMGTPEDWSPRSFRETGLGGSETAVVRLSEELAKQGRSVTVYSRIVDTNYFNGVRYRHESRYLPSVHSDVFVAWRSPELIDTAPSASRKVLWMHDTDRGEALTRERAEQFDDIVVLTNWHKQHLMETYPFLDASKLHVIGNGVDVENFMGDNIARDPHRVVYSSSPDRGLDVILEHIWPKVVEKVPDAELHIYYGWENYDKFLHYPGMADFKAKIQDLILRSRNVVNHGRIPQDQLAREFQKASVWLYPTYFTETFCITGVEAQLAGAIPVINRIAALQETVKSGLFFENVDVRNSEVQEGFAVNVIRMLQTPLEQRQDFHEAIKKDAEAESWADIARKWSSLVPSR